MAQQLNDHSLKQISSSYLDSLDAGELLHLSKNLLHDLKEARERLNQNSSNSSRPPSNRPPWEDLPEKKGEIGSQPSSSVVIPKDEATSPEEKTSGAEKIATPPPVEAAVAKKPSGRKPGKQLGAPGHGRTWHPTITQHIRHQSECCAACGAKFNEQTLYVAYSAFDSIDLQWGCRKTPGVTVEVTRHALTESHCVCAHITRSVPYRKNSTMYPSVEVTEWRLIGPNLASLIVHLRLRWRLSVRRTQELLDEVLGIPLSVGALQQCYEEVAAGAEPLDDTLVQELIGDVVGDGPTASTDVLHIDETSWKEGPLRLWLWVFVSRQTVCFWIGYRTKEILENVLGATFSGWIMSDGYQAYRSYLNRFRCWAHLLRKARGLAESLDVEGSTFGHQVLTLLGLLQTAIYVWRDANPGEKTETEALAAKFAQEIEEFRRQCLAASRSKHEKTAALAKEFMNDWDVIFRLLRYPWMPLTNNEAERALRHWVILRKITHGTKSENGSRALALLASITATCRLRNASSLAYLAELIKAARIGDALPPLPPKCVGV